MANRKRNIKLNIRVSEHEQALIQKKMVNLSTTNFEAYARKMLIDGYVINVDMTDIKELVLLLRNSSNNLNQIARRINSTGSIYAEDVEDLRTRYAELWGAVSLIVSKLERI